MYDDAWRQSVLCASINVLDFAFGRFSNRGLIRGLWGLRLINKTLYTLPHPQRPSRRVYSAGQEEAVTKLPVQTVRFVPPPRAA